MFLCPLQVLTAAPALHSLKVRERWDVLDILKFLHHIHSDLRKLIIELDEDSTGLLANIVPFYPDLEVLSLECPNRLKSNDYCLIAQLKKLSELNLTMCDKRDVFVTHTYRPRRTTYSNILRINTVSNR